MIKHFRNNKFSKVFILEFVVLTIAFVSLFIPNKTYTTQQQNVTSDKPGDKIISTRALTLPFGRYVVKTNYSSNDNMTITPIEKDSFMSFGGIKCESAIAGKEFNETQFEFWVDSLYSDVVLEYKTDAFSHSSINHITIEKTKFGRFVFTLIWICICIFTSIYARVKDKRITVNRESKISFFAVLCITFIASIPLFTPYLPGGENLSFVLTRIEGVKDALYAGQIPVRLEPTFLNGYGYAYSTFTGGIVFYLPAILRLSGFTLQGSYKLFVLIINIITAASSFRLFKYIFNKYYYGILGAALYSLNSFYFVQIYHDTALSYAVVYALLPLLILSFFKLFKKEYVKGYDILWCNMAISFSFILQTDLLCANIIALAFLIICICYIKRTVRYRTIINLVKFVGGTVFINMSFILPLFDNIYHNKFFINSSAVYTASNNTETINLFDYMFFQFPEYGADTWSEEIYLSVPGPAIAIGVIVSLLLIIFIRNKTNKSEGKIFWLISSGLSFILISPWFPWRYIENNISNSSGTFKYYAGNILLSVKEHNQFYLIAIVCFCGLIICGIKRAEENKRVFLIICTVIGTLITSQFLILATSKFISTINIKDKKLAVTIFDSEINTQIGKGEYLPYTSKNLFLFSEMFNDYSIVSVNSETSNYIRKKDGLSFEVTTSEQKQGWIEIPLLYYDGYYVYDKISGKEIDIFMSDVGRIAFVMPGLTTYDVNVKFVGKKSWNQCDIISAISILAVIIFQFLSHSKLDYTERQEEKNE